MRKAKGFVAVLVLAGLAGLAVAVAVPSKTVAAAPYLWDDRSTVGVVPVRGAPTSSATPTWFTEGTTFDMYCYTDFQNYTGNYTSRRWFWGQARNTKMAKIGYAHSSHVKRQVWVPHC